MEKHPSPGVRVLNCYEITQFFSVLELKGCFSETLMDLEERIQVSANGEKTLEIGPSETTILEAFVEEVIKAKYFGQSNPLMFQSMGRQLRNMRQQELADAGATGA